jgi:hypothetical protein
MAAVRIYPLNACLRQVQFSKGLTDKGRLPISRETFQ